MPDDFILAEQLAEGTTTVTPLSAYKLSGYVAISDEMRRDIAPTPEERTEDAWARIGRHILDGTGLEEFAEAWNRIPFVAGRWLRRFRIIR